MPHIDALRPLLPTPQYNPSVVNKPSPEDVTGTNLDTRPVPAPVKVDDAPVKDSTTKQVIIDIVV